MANPDLLGFLSSAQTSQRLTGGYLKTTAQGPQRITCLCRQTSWAPRPGRWPRRRLHCVCGLPRPSAHQACPRRRPGCPKEGCGQPTWSPVPPNTGCRAPQHPLALRQAAAAGEGSCWEVWCYWCETGSEGFSLQAHLQKALAGSHWLRAGFPNMAPGALG